MHYILDERVPRRVDATTWKRWMVSANRTVARTVVDSHITVSTVFVGLDLGGEPDRPILFETEVVVSDVASTDSRHIRYATWDEAELGHMHIIRECCRRSE